MSVYDFLIPGSIDRPTGGSRYDRAMITGLRDRGLRVNVHELPGDFPGPDETAQAMLTQCLDSLPDASQVIVDGLVLGGWPACFQPHAKRLCLIALIHHPLTDETGLDKQTAARRHASEREALRLVNGVITTSAFTARRLPRLDLYYGPVSVVPPGCAPAPLSPQHKRKRVELLCLGALIERKGQDRLIEALKTLTALPWNAWLVGADDLDPAFAQARREQVSHYGLEPRIKITGALAREPLERIWTKTDVFVLPSRYEGYGMVVTEAVARGIPVITTDAGALPDTLPDGAGLWVANADEHALHEALHRVLADPDLRQKLRAGAMAARAHLHDWPVRVGNFNDALKRINAHA